MTLTKNRNSKEKSPHRLGQSRLNQDHVEPTKEEPTSSQINASQIGEQLNGVSIAQQNVCANLGGNTVNHEVQDGTSKLNNAETNKENISLNGQLTCEDLVGSISVNNNLDEQQKGQDPLVPTSNAIEDIDLSDMAELEVGSLQAINDLDSGEEKEDEKEEETPPARRPKRSAKSTQVFNISEIRCYVCGKKFSVNYLSYCHSERTACSVQCLFKANNLANN